MKEAEYRLTIAEVKIRAINLLDRAMAFDSFAAEIIRDSLRLVTIPGVQELETDPEQDLDKLEELMNILIFCEDLENAQLRQD